MEAAHYETTILRQFSGLYLDSTSSGVCWKSKSLRTGIWMSSTVLWGCTLMFRRDTVVDGTIIHALSSTKDKDAYRNASDEVKDFELHSFEPAALS
jgi:IS5 family transposase